MSTLVTTNLKNPSNPGNNLVLEANGSVLFSAGTSTVPSISFTGDLNTGIYSPGADQVAISTNGTGRLFIGATGGVGVGANALTNSFEVVGSAGIVGTSGIAPALRIQAGSGVTDGFSRGSIQFYDQAGTGGYVLEGAQDAGRMRLFTRSGGVNSERLCITSAGLVGIGTSSPGAGLHVANTPIWAGATTASTSGVIAMYGDGNNGTIEAFAGNNSSTKRNVCLAPYGGSVGIGTADPAEKLEVRDGNIGLDSAGSAVGDRTTERFYKRTDNGSTNGMAAIGMNGAGTNGFLGEIKFYTGASDVFNTSLSERARIDSSGRLLVGTSSALSVNNVSAGVEVHATATNNGASVSIARFNNDFSGPQLILGKSRNATVTAGTVVQDNDELGQLVFNGDDGTDLNTAAARIQAFVDGTPGTNDMPGRLVFSTTADGASSSTERMRIDSSGRVGIGTTSPGSELHIQGALSGGQLLVATNQTNATEKYGTFGAVHYTNAEEPALGVAVQSNSTDNNVLIGGALGEFNAATTVRFYTAANNTTTTGSERARIDSSGRLLVGTSSALGGINSTVQIAGTTSVAGLQIIRFNSTDGCIVDFSSNRNATVNNYTTAVNGDELVRLRFLGYDGANQQVAAQITANVDGTPGANDMPGRLVFSTTSDGASSPTERMRITSAGNVGIGTASPGSALNIGADGDFWLASSVNTVEEKNLISWRIEDGSEGARISAFREALANAPHSIIFSTRTSDGLTDEKARIDSSGSLLVGTSSSSADAKFIVQGGKSSLAGAVNIQRNAITVPSANRTIGFINFTNSANDVGATISATSDEAWSAGTSHPTQLAFSTTANGASSPTERMRITNVGSVLVGKTVDNTTDIGTVIGPDGYGYFVRGSNVPLVINRLTTDGTLVSLRQDSTEEGTISVSGTTVSYNGAHLSRWSQLPSGQERTEILRGTVLSNIDEMCEWGDEDNEQLNRMKVSDVEGDKNVSGVFQAWDDDDDTYTNDFYCAMTGDFIIRIGAGVTVERGDLLMSAGDGTAKPQDDDIIRSKTIAKVTSTNVSCTYDDGSYCVPCVLMAC